MALTRTEVEGIGEVDIFRRKGLRYLRISISREGRVRLSIPWYVTKSVGIIYLISKKDWVEKHRLIKFSGWKNGQRLTDKITLRLYQAESSKVYSDISNGSLNIYLPKNHKEIKKQEVISNQIKKFLKNEAEIQLTPFLQKAATSFGYEVKDVKIKSMKSRWGSCSQEKVITLNSSMVRLPLELAEYVIYHELAHTKYLNHGKEFWNEVESKVPDYKERRKKLRGFNPAGLF